MISSLKTVVRVGLGLLLIASIGLLLLARGCFAAPAEDSIFWQAGRDGDGRGCALTAPWPAPRDVALCQSIGSTPFPDGPGAAILPGEGVDRPRPQDDGSAA